VKDGNQIHEQVKRQVKLLSAWYKMH
jgi:hypothetical protein